MDPLLTAAILFAVGIALIALELILPGGILGAAGALATGGAVVACFFHSPGAGAASLGGLVILGPVVGWLWVHNLQRMPGARRVVLGPNDTSGVAPAPADPPRPGQVGVAVSELRPSGVAEFNDERVQVISETGMIAAGTRVYVVSYADGRAVVRA